MRSSKDANARQRRSEAELLESTASDGMTFADRLADGQCRPKFASQAAADCAVGERVSAKGGVESAELGRNRPQITGNVGNPLNRDGRHGDLRPKINLPSITAAYRWL
jgi:hypothetical protein